MRNEEDVSNNRILDRLWRGDPRREGEREERK